MSKQIIAVLTSPCSKSEDARQLISEITGDGNKDTTTCQWHIDNKYYETDVTFHVCDDVTAAGKELEDDNVEAVILVTNSSKDSLTNLASQMEVIDKWSPQVRLLICEKCSEEEDGEEGLNRGLVLHWCLEHEMELIEMKPDSDDCEVEDYGINRIVAALQSHTWPDLQLKSASKTTAKSKKTESSASTSGPVEAAKPADSDDNDDANEERFTQEMQALMSKMQSLQALSKGTKEDRVKYAEDITKAFCEILGGDDGEFDSD